jgi:hypothetical protein
VPILDLAQNRFQILSDRFLTFAGILNFNGLRGYSLGEVSLARQWVELVREIRWYEKACPWQ